mgnify:CR=1 FL=1
MSHVDEQQTTYPLHTFQYNPEDRIFYLSTYNESEYGYSDGRRVEEYIHSSIRNTHDVSDGSPELISKIKDWPTYYHFSIERANIFRCLDINPNSKVIEFGAGCGAITRYLGENFTSVDSIEGSKNRARIVRDRCRDLDNVRVFCSNIEDIQLNPEYDIATLIGVLEYAPVYFSDNHNPNLACLNLLKIARSAIKENGTLILAIENKIGLKYWSGCPEDHTGTLYEGLHNYPNQVEPVTFSKKEIIALLEAAGFNNCTVLSCFPDYKFASTIINNIDGGNNYYLHNWVEIPFTAYNIARKYSFHEGLALRTLSEAGLLGECANSFLILASSGNSASVGEIDWAAKKISAKRRKELRCQTTLKLTPQPFVEKKRLYGEEKNITFANTRFKLCHRVSNATWIAGNTLLNEMYTAGCKKDSYEIIEQLLARYYGETLKRYATGTSDEQGYPLLKGTSLDFIPRNIIKFNDILESIDEEWIIDGDIPADYLLYRFLTNDFFGSQKPWIKKKFRNKNYATIKLVQTIFPQYGVRRHMKNIENERLFQDLVTGGIKYGMPRQNLYSYIRDFAALFSN